MSDKENVGSKPAVDESYKVGTLVYTKVGLFAVSGWMIMANLCFGLFEGNGGAGSIPFYLQENFHVSNTLISLLFNFIPMIIGTIMTPIISFRSDRTRSRLGRRIPYILYTAPFLVLFAIALGFSDDIIAYCKLRFTAGSMVGPMTAALIAIGFLTIGWSFFNEFVGTVYYYLVPDVMPRKVLGRFQAVSNMAGTVVGIGMNTFVSPYQLTHIKAIHVGVAILYFVGFGLMCWRVKEGQYPPVEDVHEDSTFLDKAKLYFKECFHHPIYIMIYMVTVFTVLGKGLNAAGIFGLHLSQHQSKIEAHAGGVTAVAMAADSKLAVSAGRDGALKVWDQSNVKKPALLRTLHGTNGPASAVALSPGARAAVAGTSNGVVEIWDVEGGTCIRTLAGHAGEVRSVAVSKDGSRLATAGADRTVRVWDMASGVCMLVLTNHADAVNCVAFSSTGERLVSGAADRNIIVWDATLGTVVRVLEGSPGPVYAVCFAPELAPVPPPVLDGKGKVRAALAASWVFTKRVFVNESLYEVPMDEISRIVGEDRWVVSGGRDGDTDEVNSALRIWDVERGAPIAALESFKGKALKGHKRAISAVAYKPDIRVILSSSLDGSVRMWKPLSIGTSANKTADDKSFKSFSGYTRGITAFDCQSAGVVMVSASVDGTLHAWDIDQGISLEKNSKYAGNFFAILALIMAFPLGLLLDRWNPIRVFIVTAFVALPMQMLYFFFYRDYMSGLWMNLVMMPINTLHGMSALPMMVMLYPKSKYGQFSSANAMVRQFVGAFAGLLGAVFMDYLTAGSLDTDNYRYGFLIKFFLSLGSFVCLIGVYYYWKKMGAENYEAPESRHTEK